MQEINFFTQLAGALPPEKLIKEVILQETGNNLRLYYVELEKNLWVLLGGGLDPMARRENHLLHYMKPKSLLRFFLR
jgi:hypothetical protein